MAKHLRSFLVPVCSAFPAAFTPASLAPLFIPVAYAFPAPSLAKPSSFGLEYWKG